MGNADKIKIGSDSLRAMVCPNFGGILSTLQFYKENSWHDLCFNASELVEQGKKALFIMAPLTARTKNGKFPWNGEIFDLKASWNPHAIHCWAPKLPWKRLESSDNYALIQVKSTEFSQVFYPSDFEVSIKYEIKNSTLSITTTIKNIGQNSMPATGGTHPMFLKKILGSDKIQLKLDAPLWFPPSEEFPNDPMPSGLLTEIPRELDFRTTKDIVTGYDCTLANWNGIAEVTWPDVGLSLICKDELGNCPLIHYWHIPSRDTWAIEPLLGIADAPNLAKNFQNTGLKKLNPGESVKTTHSFEIKLLP